MNKHVLILTGILVGIGCFVFAFGVAEACIISWNPNRSDYFLAPFMLNAVMSISVILSTNFGAVLGIAAADTTSQFARSENWKLKSFLKNPNQAKFQILASYLYLLALLASLVVWWHRDFVDDPSKIVSLIPNLSITLLGVIVGAMALVLNVKQASKK